MNKKEISQITSFVMRDCHAESETKAIFANGIADIAEYTGISSEAEIEKLTSRLSAISEIKTTIGELEGAYSRPPHDSEFFEGTERGGYVFTPANDGLSLEITTNIEGKNQDRYIEMHGKMALVEIITNNDEVSNKSLNEAIQSNIAKGSINIYKYIDSYENNYIGYDAYHPAFLTGHPSIHATTFLGDTKFIVETVDSADRRNVPIQSVANCLMQNESFVRSYLLGEECTIDIEKISQLCSQYQETKDLKYIIQAERIIIEQTLEDTIQNGKTSDYIIAISRFDREKEITEAENTCKTCIDLQSRKGEISIPVSHLVIDEKIITDLYSKRDGVDISKELNQTTRSQDCKDFLLAVKGAAEAGIRADNSFEDISYERNKRGNLVVTCGDQKIEVSGRELFNGIMYVKEAHDLSISAGFQRMKEHISYNGLSDFIRSAVKGELTPEPSSNESLDAAACRQVRENTIPIEDIIDRGEHSIQLLIENPGVLSRYSEAMTESLIDDAIRNTDFAEHNSRGDNILHILANDESELSKQIIAELKENHTEIYVKLLNEENYAGKIPLDYIQEAKDNDVSKTAATESVLDSDTLKKLETEAVIDDGEDKIIGVHNDMVIEY